MTNKPAYLEKRFIYGRIFRIIHWTVALFFLSAVTLIYARNFIDDPGLDKQFVAMHRGFGMLVMLMAVFRLIWRITTREYPYTGNSPLLQFVASISHAALYLLLLITPFLGWMEASARHKPVAIFGLDLPMLIDRNLELAEELQSWHIALATGFCIVILIHVFSALWHHFYRRDGVLYSMIPIPALRKPWVERATRELDAAANNTPNNLNPEKNSEA
ncbi:MAG: cytochrome b [Methylomonas sp.]|jgi:cytochrome b561